MAHQLIAGVLRLRNHRQHERAMHHYELELTELLSPCAAAATAAGWLWLYYALYLAACSCQPWSAHLFQELSVVSHGCCNIHHATRTDSIDAPMQCGCVDASMQSAGVYPLAIILRWRQRASIDQRNAWSSLEAALGTRDGLPAPPFA